VGPYPLQLGFDQEALQKVAKTINNKQCYDKRKGHNLFLERHTGCLSAEALAWGTSYPKRKTAATAVFRFD